MSSISGIGISGWSVQTASKNQKNLPANFITSAFSTASATTTTAGTASATSNAAALVPASSPIAAQEFSNYMKESPAQQMEDAWLSEHGISKQQFTAMDADDKQKIINQMQADLEAKAKQKTEASAYATTDLAA